MKKKLAGLAGVFLLAMTPAGANAASGSSWTVSTNGSRVTFYNGPSGSTTESFKVCDTAADGNSVYVRWQFNGGSGREQQYGGNGSCVTFSHNWAEGLTVKFQSCEDVNNFWDDCSGWVTAIS